MEKNTIFTVLVIMIFIVSCDGTDDPYEEYLIQLHAKDAELITDASLVYESHPDRECIGFWTSPDDQIIWDFDVDKEGEYSILVRVACGQVEGFPQAGSTIGLTLDGQTFIFIMPDTGVWESYINVDIGNINLTPGSYTLVVQGISLKVWYFGNLQAILLPRLN